MVQWLRICLPGDTRVGVCMCEIHVDIWQKPPQYCNYPPNENKIVKKKNPPSNARDRGSIPGWGTKML